MSNELEPRTSARCTVFTSKGRVELELWAKECPHTVRNFLAKCGEGAFDGITLNKKLFDSIIHTEAPANGSISPLEVNTRLRFNRRGLIGTFPDSKGAFFITLIEANNLNDKATMFGKVVANSFYDVIKIAGGELEADQETFMYPAAIDHIEITEPYFKDLPKKKDAAEDKRPRKKMKKASKVKLIYEDDEDDVDYKDGGDSKVLDIKIRAAHDLLNNDKLIKGKVASFEQSDDECSPDSNNSSQTQTVQSTSPERNIQEEKQHELAPDFSELLDAQPSDREKETLKLLAIFQEKAKGKFSLTSHVLNFTKNKSTEDDSSEQP